MIGTQITKYRAEKLWTMDALALAAELGVSRSRLFKWESGQTDPPVKYLRPLAKALECSLDELFGPEERPTGLDGSYMKITGREPGGRLVINVTNMGDLKKLLQQADAQSKSLARTIRRISAFNLSVDFVGQED